MTSTRGRLKIFDYLRAAYHRQCQGMAWTVLSSELDVAVTIA
jgi:hypothetical protein